MTTEEKARAYDEAIERARRIKNREDNWRYSDLTEIIPALEEVLPELAESEEERALRIIRKRMCYDPVPISDEDRRIVENWLEKQKENTEELEYRLNGLMQEYIEEGEDEEEHEHRFKCYKLFWDALEDSSYFDEQKSAEWSEEDLICLGYLADFVDKNGDKFYGDNKPNVVKWIRSFMNHPIPELAEWSEEEYGRLFDIEHYLHGTLQLSPDRRIACINFLKALKNRGNSLKSNTNSPKWSEEDEAICGFIYDLLASLTWKEDWCVDEVTCLNWVNTRLKSLKPQNSNNISISPERLKELRDRSFEDGRKAGIVEMAKSMWKPRNGLCTLCCEKSLKAEG